MSRLSCWIRETMTFIISAYPALETPVRHGIVKQLGAAIHPYRFVTGVLQSDIPTFQVS